MGKHKHHKDRLYIIQSEYANDWGGYKKPAAGTPYKCLPYDICGLTLNPLTKKSKIVGMQNGILFDAKILLPYIWLNKTDPITGKKDISLKDLFPVTLHTNADGKFHCPIMEKPFTSHSNIVINRKTGHVYSKEAIDAMCRKANYWADLITGEPMSNKDLVTIQSATEATKRHIADFYWKRDPAAPQPEDLPTTSKEIWSEINKEFCCAIEKATRPAEPLDEDNATKIAKTEIKPEVKRNEQVPCQPAHSESTKLNAVSTMTSRILQKVNQDSTFKQKHRTLIGSGKPKPEESSNPRHTLYTTHGQAASFTSTAVEKALTTEYRHLTDEEVRAELYKTVRSKKAKGYVRLVTTLGLLNFELHCDITPVACDNFLRHCETGYYKNCYFFRSIPNFMIQTGSMNYKADAQKKTKRDHEDSDRSAFPDQLPFKDEFDNRLLHNEGGVLAMANKGPHTNLSQFYITYKACPHLNNKHTVFGKLVGGREVLVEMAKLKTDTETDRPENMPYITDCIVYKNPFQEASENSMAEEPTSTSKDLKPEDDAPRLKSEELKWKLRDSAVMSNLLLNKLTPSNLLYYDREPVFSSDIGKYLKKP